MIACDIYPQIPCSLWQCDDQRFSIRLGLDPIWDSIQNEAIAAAESEPVLQAMLQQSVIGRESTSEALATILSERLSNRWVDSTSLLGQIRDIARQDADLDRAAAEDLRAIQANDPAAVGLLHPFLNFKGFLAVQAHRIAHALWNQRRRTLAYHLQSRVSDVFGVDIHPAATIGRGVFVDHGTGVVIGETAVVGNNVTMLHGVTLGGTGKETGDRHPKVRSGVFIGAGAQLLGNIVIGEGSQVGASSVVLADVPANCTVAGIPAKVVRRRSQGDAGFEISDRVGAPSTSQGA